MTLEVEPLKETFAKKQQPYLEDGDQKFKILDEEGTNEEFPYQSLIGSIMYLSRPDKLLHAQ